MTFFDFLDLAFVVSLIYIMFWLYKTLSSIDTSLKTIQEDVHKLLKKDE